MSVQQILENTLTSGLNLTHLEVINESGNHNVPKGSESHFKVTVVSDGFEGKSLIARHRVVNQLLSELLQTQIHALALHVYTPAEWQEKNGQVPASPPCLGGAKR